MALSAKVGTFDANAGAGAEAITGVGFTPKALLLLYNRLNGSTTATDSTWLIGAAASSSSMASASSAANNTTVEDANSAESSADIMYMCDITAAIVLDVELTSFDADGFTLNFTTELVGASTVTYLALGGDDLTNAKVGTFDEATTTGDDSITGVGFQPDCVFIFGSSENTAALPNNTDGNIQNRIGIATAATQAVFVGQNVDAADPSNTNTYQQTDAVLARLNGSTVNAEATLASMDADGFTLNYSVSSGVAPHLFYLALKGGNYKVGSFSQATGTGAQSSTDPAFTPKALFFMSYDRAASASSQVNNELSMGLTSGASNETALWNYSEDAVGTMVTAVAQNTSAVFTNRQATPTTIDAEADTTSLDANGWTLNWSTADATAREIIYWAMGDTAAAGGTIGHLVGPGSLVNGGILTAGRLIRN